MGRKSKWEPSDGHKVTAEEILNGHSPGELQELFDKYVMPNLEDIHYLTQYYTQDKQYVEENYNHVLCQLYKYSYSYNPEQSIRTWFHIITKREVQRLNKNLSTQRAKNDGVGFGRLEADVNVSDIISKAMTSDSILDNVSDAVLVALQKTPPTFLSPFIAYAQGYTYEEIADMECEKGYLEGDVKDAVRIIKNRIYLAKKTIKEQLKKHGITRTIDQG